MAYLNNLGRSPSSSPRSPRPTVVDVPTTLVSSSSSSSMFRQLIPLDAHQFGNRCGMCRKGPHPNEPHINALTSPCHHIFCHECMLQWILLSKKTVCPLSHCACELAKVILTKQCPKSRAELVGLMKSFEGNRAIVRFDHLVYYEGADILDEIKRLNQSEEAEVEKLVVNFEKIKLERELKPESSFRQPFDAEFATDGPSATPTTSGAMTFSQVAAQASPRHRAQSLSPIHFRDRQIGNRSAGYYHRRHLKRLAREQRKATPNHNQSIASQRRLAYRWRKNKKNNF